MKGHNLVKAIEKSIVENWDLPALSDYKVSDLTYAETGERMVRMHLLFEACGVEQGDKIALIGKNSVQWAITYFATITYGATLVPILSDFSPENIQNIVNHSDAKLLFADEAIIKKLDTTAFNNLYAIYQLGTCKVYYKYTIGVEDVDCELLASIFNNRYPNGISKQDIHFLPVDNESTAILSYTSGTTGFSKGVMIPYRSLMANVHFAWNNMPLKSGDNLLSILPSAHSFGGTFECLWPFTIGVHITFLGKTVSPQVMIQAFGEIKPRLILMVPLIIEKIYKKQIQPLLAEPKIKFFLQIPLVNKLIYRKIHKKLKEVFGGNFREIVIGGAALNREVEVFLRNIRFNYSVGYGMTECGPLISYSNWDKTTLGSCGQLVDSLEIKIDSPDPEHIPGEIMVKGANVMQGYYKNESETDKVISADGWLHTGDLGVVDGKGFIHIRGRSKCMILGPSGENIYPEEIESKLNNYPYILEQLVIADNHKLVALVYPDFNKLQTEQISEEELIQIMENTKNHINKSLPKYSQLSQIQIRTEEFEKTPKQSIKRFMYEVNS